MTLQGGSVNMDDEEETMYGAIDIIDLNYLKQQYGSNQQSYFGSGGTQSFFLDDINVVGCGHSNHTKFVKEIQSTNTTPIVSMFEGELLSLRWSRQYFLQNPLNLQQMSNAAQCMFSPSGKLIVVQFNDDYIRTTSRGSPIIAVLDSATGEIRKSYIPNFYGTQMVQNLKVGVGRDFQIKIISENKVTAIYRLQQQLSSLIIAEFNSMDLDLNSQQQGSKIVAYQTMSLTNMQAVDLRALAFDLSDDRKQLYISGTLESVSNIFRWNIEVKKIEWHFILIDTEINSNLKHHQIEIQHMNHKLNKSLDDGHIVYCAKVVSNIEKRTMIGYVLEKKYSIGGASPILQKLLLIDPEAKGQCQDLFLDLKLRQLSVFITSPFQSYSNQGRSLIITMPIIDISSNITVKALNIGQKISPTSYIFDLNSDFGVLLTGINRGYFGGKTIQWDTKSSKMGLISSYPTSYLIQNDPLTDGFFIHYNPLQFVQISPINFTLDQKPFIYSFVSPLNQQSQNCFYVDDAPKVGIPSIKITYSMEGDTQFTYTTTKPPLYIVLKFYVSGTCNDVPLSYQVQVEPDINIDSFISYNGSQAIIYTNKKIIAGIYSIKITASTPNNINRTAGFAVRVNELPLSQMISTAKSAPYFASNLIKFLNISFQCTKIYQIPKIINTNPLVQAKISFKTQKLDGLPKFIKFQNERLIITPNETVDIDIYEMDIQLFNEDQAQTYRIYVQILPKSEQIYDNRVTIDTSQRQYFDIQSKKENFPIVQLMRVNNKGEVSLIFAYKEDNIISNNGNSMLKPKIKIVEDNFHFQIDPFQELKWKIIYTSVDQKQMTVQLTFSNPDRVSMSSLNRAKLKMFFKPSIGFQLNTNSRFLQTATEAFLFFQNVTEVPVQLSSKKVTKFFDSVSDAFKSITTSILATNLSFTFMLSCSMQLLWSFVNSLQLISLIPLMNLVIPSNLYYVCSLIQGPLSLKFIDISNFTSRLFRLEQQYKAYSSHFEAFGFQNTQVILDMQISLYVILASPAIMLILYILTKITLKCQGANRISKKLTRMMQYSFYVRLLIEEFILIFISSLINVMRPSYNTWGEIFSFSMAIILIVLTISLPIILTIYILKTKQTIEKRKKIGEKLGSIYKDMRKDTAMRLLFSAFYVIRRIIFVFSVLFIDSCPMIQIFLFHLASIVQFIYLGIWRPFEDPKQNRLELINEGCVLLVSTLLPAFTDYLEDDTGRTQKALGWVVLVIIFTQCALNILLQLKDQWIKVKITWMKVKRCRQQQSRVKFMGETIKDIDIAKNFSETGENNQKNEKALRRKGQSEDLYATGKEWKLSTQQIEQMPIAEIPNHDQSFARGVGSCLNLESLQLFTPRGLHLFGPQIYCEDHLPEELRIQEIIEEQKEEEDLPNYNPSRHLYYQERAGTAENQYQRQRKNENHIVKLQRVSTLNNQDEFMSQFSIISSQNNNKGTLESARIRVIPSTGVITRQTTLDTMALDPLATLCNQSNPTISGNHRKLTTTNQNHLSSTMPTTAHQLNDSPEQKSSSSGGNNSRMDTSYDKMRVKIGSSEGSSNEGSRQGLRVRPKQPNSRIKIYN